MVYLKKILRKYFLFLNEKIRKEIKYKGIQINIKYLITLIILFI